eukprot:2158487-Rhodomonas_salina.1
MSGPASSILSCQREKEENKGEWEENQREGYGRQGTRRNEEKKRGKKTKETEEDGPSYGEGRRGAVKRADEHKHVIDSDAHEDEREQRRDLA